MQNSTQIIHHLITKKRNAEYLTPHFAQSLITSIKKGANIFSHHFRFIELRCLLHFLEWNICHIFTVILWLLTCTLCACLWIKACTLSTSLLLCVIHLL